MDFLESCDAVVTYNQEYDKRLRAGFIGCGSHSFRNVYTVFQYVPVELIAVCDLDETKGNEYKRIFGAQSVYTNHMDMLEKEELVVRENIVSDENRLQKHYSISEKGRQILRQKLTTLLANPEHMRWPLDIALYNISLVPPAEIITALQAYRGKLLSDIQGYKDLLQFLMDSGCPAHRFEVARRPILLLQADLTWVDSYLETLT